MFRYGYHKYKSGNAAGWQGYLRLPFVTLFYGVDGCWSRLYWNK